MSKKTVFFYNNVAVKGILANGSMGADGQVLTTNGTSTYWSTVVSGGGGTGNVGGPASSTNNALARFDGTTGALIKNSSITVDDSGNMIIAGTLSAANTTLSGFVNVSSTGATLRIGNATVFATVNATNFSGISNNSLALNGFTFASPSVLGSTAANGAYLTFANVSGNVNTATIFVTTSANIASATLANATGVYTTGVMNAASQTVGTSFIANSTALVTTGYVNVASDAASLRIGNSTIFTVVNSTVFTGSANNASFLNGSTFASPSVIGATTANGGSFTYANVSGQVNTVTLYVTTSANIASSTLANATGVYSTGTINAASHTVGTAFIANTVGITTTGYANVITTLAAGNTTITGFVNATSSVNAASHTVGTSFIANTLGVYSTGTMNAASQTVGSSFIANSTALVSTGYVNVASDSASLRVGNSTIFTVVNSTTFTGTANNSSFIGGFTLASPPVLGSTAANGASLTYANVSGQVNTASLYVTTTANIASATLANATGVYSTGTVNAASHTVGTNFIANATAVVATGYVNVASDSAVVRIGNSTVFATINSTAFSGSATVNWASPGTIGSTTANTGRFTTGTFTGKLTTMAASGTAGFNLPHGSAPTPAVNGDLWTTSTALYAMVNNAVVTVPNLSDTVTISATGLGVVGAIAYNSTTNTAAAWSLLPVGYARMFSSSITTAGGLPINGNGYFNKLANRDFANGWIGLWTGQNTGNNYIGRASTYTDFPTWERIWTDNTAITSPTFGGTVTTANASIVGTMFTGATVSTGNGSSTGDATIELGGLRSANGNAIFDLHAVNSTDYETRIIRYAGTNGLFQIINSGTGDFYVSQSGNAGLIFQTNSTERMRIAGNGHVGIGVTTPLYKLHVGGDFVAGLSSQPDLYNVGIFGRAPVGGTVDWDFKTNDVTYGAKTIMTLNASGGLNIGTITRAGTSAVTIAGGAIHHTGTGSGINVQMRNDSGSGVYMLGTTTAAAPDLTFLNNGGFEAARLTNAGQLLIGTSSPSLSAKLEVQGGRTWLTGGSEPWSVGVRYNSSGGAFWIGATNSASPDMIFSKDTGEERMRLTNAGVLNSAGGYLSYGGNIGFTTGAGGAATQATSRTTGVTVNKSCGSITLVSAAGSATWNTFTVTNSTVAATDVISVSQQTGTNLYNVIVTNVSAGSFKVSVSSVSGTATEAPIINFVVIKAVTS